MPPALWSTWGLPLGTGLATGHLCPRALLPGFYLLLGRTPLGGFGWSLTQFSDAETASGHALQGARAWQSWDPGSEGSPWPLPHQPPTALLSLLGGLPHPVHSLHGLAREGAPRSRCRCPRQACCEPSAFLSTALKHKPDWPGPPLLRILQQLKTKYRRGL